MATAKLTSDRIAAFTCGEKQQAFLYDTTVPGLGVRATSGGKSYIFQGRLNGRSLRVTIGDVRTWTIKAAQTEARRLQMLLDSGRDPRVVKADEFADTETRRQANEARNALERAKQEVIARDAWNAYLSAPHPRWGHLHRIDHVVAASAGGVARKRGGGATKPGPLAPLLSMRLNDITAPVVAHWLQEESTVRPTFTHNAFRKFRAFIHWCSKHPQFQNVVHTDCCTADEVKDLIPAGRAKEGDCLQREQLHGWFSCVRQLQNAVISTYLQTLLLTGARRTELATLKWVDVDFKWRSLTIRDKVDGMRTIPLTPYVAQLIDALPRRNDWVFSSPAAASGHIAEPRIAHTQALQTAGLPHISLHGLRRSFGTLAEWVEVPVGVVAQIQGHKPSALAEKHYRRRPLDLLRAWHEKIEIWILKESGIEFAPTASSVRSADS